jgi:HPt (histidine-containing phosphotransfer) domain-containing protein
MNTSHLDQAYLKTIIDLLGGEQFALLKDQFVKDCDKASAMLLTAITQGDETQVRRQAHLLKGVLAQYGARRGEAIAARLVDDLPSDWRSVVQDLLDETAKACTEMAVLAGT